MTHVAIKPPPSALGRANAVLNRFAGPLSVKAVTRGCAVWETAVGRFEIVLLNNGEEYTVTIESLQPVETCLSPFHFHRLSLRS